MSYERVITNKNKGWLGSLYKDLITRGESHFPNLRE